MRSRRPRTAGWSSRSDPRASRRALSARALSDTLRHLGRRALASGARRRQAHGVPGKAFLPAEGRLEASAIVQPPQGTVSRTALVNRLRVSTASVIALLAPAGYGKSATIAQWSERDDRPFAWVACGAEDPRGLCVLIASALFQAGVVDRSTLAFVRARRGPGPALRELIAAFRSLECSTVLVLDDVHMLRSKGSADVVGAFALHVPNGSAVVLAGRSAPRASLAQVRVRGGLFEVGAEELALSRRDSKRLLRGLGVELAPAAVDDLLRVTEGWPVGVYLAGLALRDGKPSGAVPGGDDRFVTDYLEFEVLSRLDGDDVRFLTHTSVLDELSGPLCDAVLDQEGSGRKLEALCRAGLFVVPLDRRRRSYRYQRAFRDYLRAELERREPHAEAGLFSRASVWCEENGRAEAAVAYAHAAGEADRVAELVGRHALATWARGSREVVETWLGWFDESYDLEGHPEIAVLQAWVHGVAGRPSASERWLALAEGTRLRQALPDGSASIEPWLAVVRAAHCARGPNACWRTPTSHLTSWGRRAAGGPRRSCCAPPRSPCWATTTSRTRRWPRRRSRPRASASSPPESSPSRSAPSWRPDGATRTVRPSLRSRPESSSTTTISRATSAARSASRCRPAGRRTGGTSSVLAPSWSAPVPWSPSSAAHCPGTRSRRRSSSCGSTCGWRTLPAPGCGWPLPTRSFGGGPCSASSSSSGPSSRRRPSGSPGSRTAEPRRSRPPSCACSRSWPRTSRSARSARTSSSPATP